MTNRTEDEIRRVVAPMDNDQEAQASGDPERTLHIHYFPDAIVITPDASLGYEQEYDTIVDAAFTVLPTDTNETKPLATAPKLTRLDSFVACIPAGVLLLVVLFSLTFQVWVVFNPPTATVTILPNTQRVTLSATLQLGRLLPPLTISQSQTTATTGKVHQDARAATGTVTFYNGQQSGQTVAQGTIFTGSDGVSIETTRQTTIPPGNPSIGYGSVTVTAQALQAGSNGNIQVGDVNTPIALAVFVKSNQFTGGQDERDFSTVSQQDINKLSTPLKTTVLQSMQAAFLGQVKPAEQLHLLPCAPTVSSDDQPGQEARQIHVTVSETCNAIAYSSQALVEKATELLTLQAVITLGPGFSLVGSVQVRLTQASVTHTSTPLVFLSFQTAGRWIYALSQKTQQHIKQLIAGKTKQEAAHILLLQTGIEQASIRFSGFGDEASVPKNNTDIHITLFVL